LFIEKFPLPAPQKLYFANTLMVFFVFQKEITSDFSHNLPKICIDVFDNSEKYLISPNEVGIKFAMKKINNCEFFCNAFQFYYYHFQGMAKNL